jgi:hypothetical protein
MKFTSPYVNKASNWLIFVKGPIRGFVYIRACEFQYELLNFTTKFFVCLHGDKTIEIIDIISMDKTYNSFVCGNTT